MNNNVVSGLIDPDIHAEAADLARGITRVEDIRALTQAFIAQRLSNSSTMESTKSRALALLQTKLDGDEANEISINRLMEIISMISEHTAADVSNMVAAFAAKSGAAGGNGKSGDTNNYNVFFGEAPPENTFNDRVTGTKSTFKLLDALDSVAMNVISEGRREDDA
jgi:hypothetical protein